MFRNFIFNTQTEEEPAFSIYEQAAIENAAIFLMKANFAISENLVKAIDMENLINYSLEHSF